MTKPGIAIGDFTSHVDEYLNLRGRMGNQPSSVRAAANDLRLLATYCAAFHLNVINGPVVIDFFSWLRTRRNNSPGAINRKRSSLCAYARFLRAKQIDGAKAFPLESLPKARKAYAGPVKVLEPDQVGMLFKAMDRSTILGQRDFTLNSLLYGLGLRLGEALAINIQDIDVDKKTIVIHGKGRKERTLPLADELLHTLTQWIKHRRHILNAANAQALFLSKKGSRLALRTAENNFKNLVEKAGPFDIERVVPHTLRHCFASHCLEKDEDLLVIKAILGHALMKSTEIYLYPSMAKQRALSNDHVAIDLVRGVRKNRQWIRGMQKHRTG